MKKILYTVLGLSLLAFLPSCSNDDFTPEVGNTSVEFVPAETFPIENQYFYIPVHQTEMSNTASVARMEIVEAYGVDIVGNRIDCVEDSVIIFTSKEIYVGPFDENEDDETTYGTAYFELSLPTYVSIDTLSLTLRLTGDNVGANSTMTYTFKSVEQYDMSGVFLIYGIYNDPNTGIDQQLQMQFAITSNIDPTNPLIYGISFGVPTGYTAQPADAIKAERFINRLVISGSYIDADGVEWVIYPYDGTNILSGDVELVFSSDDVFTATNGMFFGYVEDGSTWIMSMSSPGTQGGRQ